jgi:hypothetical protein
MSSKMFQHTSPGVGGSFGVIDLRARVVKERVVRVIASCAVVWPRVVLRSRDSTFMVGSRLIEMRFDNRLYEIGVHEEITGRMSCCGFAIMLALRAFRGGRCPAMALPRKSASPVRYGTVAVATEWF